MPGARWTPRVSRMGRWGPASEANWVASAVGIEVCPGQGGALPEARRVGAAVAHRAPGQSRALLAPAQSPLGETGQMLRAPLPGVSERGSRCSLWCSVSLSAGFCLGALLALSSGSQLGAGAPAEPRPAPCPPQHPSSLLHFIPSREARPGGCCAPQVGLVSAHWGWCSLSPATPRSPRGGAAKHGSC